MAACRAHNPEVEGSIPSSAPKISFAYNEVMISFLIGAAIALPSGPLKLEYTASRVSPPYRIELQQDRRFAVTKAIFEGRWKDLSMDWYETAKINAAIATLQDLAGTNEFAAFGFKEGNPLFRHLVNTRQLFAFNMIEAGIVFLAYRGVESLPTKTWKTVAYFIWAIVENAFAYWNHINVGVGSFPVFVPIFKVKF